MPHRLLSLRWAPARARTTAGSAPAGHEISQCSQASVKRAKRIPTRQHPAKRSFCVPSKRQHPRCYSRQPPCSTHPLGKNHNDNHIGRPAMGLQKPKIESLPFVPAELNYLAPVSGKPRTYAFDPPPGEPKSTALPEPHRLPIFNGRSVANGFSLDREGFALVRHPTAVRDFYDEKEVRNVYYPAAEAFIRSTLRADRVVIFDHTVRKRIEGAPDIRGASPRQP